MEISFFLFFFFFSSRRRHTRCLSDWSSDVCSSDLSASTGGGGGGGGSSGGCGASTSKSSLAEGAGSPADAGAAGTAFQSGGGVTVVGESVVGPYQAVTVRSSRSEERSVGKYRWSCR